MKKLFFTIVAVIAIQMVAFAGNDSMITVSQMPKAAQKFVQKYFSEKKVSYAKVDNDWHDKEYKIIFADGSSVEFDRKGEWIDISCKPNSIPQSIIPQEIQNYVAKNHKDLKIISIERSRQYYEIKLSNSLELKFNKKFMLVDIDD